MCLVVKLFRFFFLFIIFFFQAEDGIRDFCLSRGLGDVYKRQTDKGPACSLAYRLASVPCSSRNLSFWFLKTVRRVIGDLTGVLE